MKQKKIHYCWFGGKPLNRLGQICLDSWKKNFPDYEIIQWDESNFDVHCCKYVEEAYNEKKWAFVSDYARFKILYEQGGLYFDTDVEVIKSFDDLQFKKGFLGCESPDSSQSIAVNPGLGCAFEPGLDVIKEILDEYEKASFYNQDGTLNLYTIVERTTDHLKKHGLKATNEIQEINGIKIFPTEYFCPISLEDGKLRITAHTHSIHRFAASWTSNRSRIGGKVYNNIVKIIGLRNANKIRLIVNKLGI